MKAHFKIVMIPCVLLAAMACGGEKQKPATTPPPAPMLQSFAPAPAPGIERMDANGFFALMLPNRRPVAEFMQELKALAEFAAARGIKGTPFFYIYDGPCDGTAERWISDGGLWLEQMPAPEADLGPYVARQISAPSPRMIRIVSPATSISGEFSSPPAATPTPAAGTPAPRGGRITDTNSPRSGVRHACKLAKDAQMEYYKSPQYLAPAMDMIFLHGMRNFTLDEPVNLELRIPHYDLDVNGRMPGPIMPTPFPEPAKVEPAPVPPTAKPKTTKPRPKTTAKPPAKPAPKSTSTPTSTPAP